MGRELTKSFRVQIKTLLLIIIVLSGTALSRSAPDTDDRNTSRPTSMSSADGPVDLATRRRVEQIYDSLPAHFEANLGQTDQRVKFLCRGARNTLFLTATEAVLASPSARKESAKVERPEHTNPQNLFLARTEAVLASPLEEGRTKERLEHTTRNLLRMRFLGANSEPRVVGLGRLSGSANYFIGTDPQKWQSNVPMYAKVRYQDIYSGIDLIYYGTQRQLEYDFVVRPGADPRRILLGFHGADRLEVDSQGDLLLHAPGGTLRQRKPFIYQESDGVRREVAGGYVLKNGHRVGFRVDAYDNSRPLVIDPVLVYSTYMGGNGTDVGQSIAVDDLGYAYVSGDTSSSNFPTAAAYQTVSGGSFDAFVTKMNTSGTALVYSTYIGGKGDEFSRGIAIDPAGNAYIAGATSSTDFPTSVGAFQPTFGGFSNPSMAFDAFVAKFNPSGGGLVYSSYLGGNGFDAAYGVDIDGNGNAYVAGDTSSTNLPTTAGAFQKDHAASLDQYGIDAFVTKVNQTGTALVYSTYLGGSKEDLAHGIGVDGSGYAYVGGRTESNDFPTITGSFQTVFGGGPHDAFVTKVNLTGTGLSYSSYIGGNNDDLTQRVVVDVAGNAYATGATNSANFPTTAQAFQPALRDVVDAFVTKLNPTGTTLVFSTYIGGTGFETGLDIAVDPAGYVCITGATNSTDFPTTQAATQPNFGGFIDAFVTKFNPLGTQLMYSTYLGGSEFDLGRAMTMDRFGNTYVTGRTASANFPTTAGIFQSSFGGDVDAYFAKFLECLPQGQGEKDGCGILIGSGTIAVTGGTASFALILRRPTPAGVSGELFYSNNVGGQKLQSLNLTSFLIMGNNASFGGVGVSDGAEHQFVVVVTDNNPDTPGTADKFSIFISNGLQEGGALLTGDIQLLIK